MKFVNTTTKDSFFFRLSMVFNKKIEQKRATVKKYISKGDATELLLKVYAGSDIFGIRVKNTAKNIETWQEFECCNNPEQVFEFE